MEVKAIRLIIEQNEYRGVVIDSLQNKIKLKDRKIEFLENEGAMKDTIIGYKDMQIEELENKPAIVEKTPFLTHVILTTIGILLGLVGGLMYAK